MMKNIKIYMFVICLFIMNIFILQSKISFLNPDVNIQFELISEEETSVQYFYKSNNESFSEENSITIHQNSHSETPLFFPINSDITEVRIDLGQKPSSYYLKNLQVLTNSTSEALIINPNNIFTNDIEYFEEIDNNFYKIVANGNDPYLIIPIQEILSQAIVMNFNILSYGLKIIFCIVYTILALLLYKRFNFIYQVFSDFKSEKKLIWSLAKNDFKTKYSGSLLGVFWAFVQPIVIILMYWFVFEVGFKSAPVNNFPYVLWLISGLIPWLFFSEALMNATNCLIEYTYLVKKVLFEINILPVIKILSSLFVHVFFIFFIILIFIVSQNYPTLYLVQIFYYLLCSIVLILGLSFITSSLIVFFKDLGQLINIFLQVGLWVTPILWNLEMMPQEYHWILKLNPVHYIVDGYRDSLINHIWFWQKPELTVYFWSVTVCILIGGIVIFKKLRPHFADVL